MTLYQLFHAVGALFGASFGFRLGRTYERLRPRSKSGDGTIAGLKK